MSNNNAVTLYKIDSKGKLRFWSVEATDDGEVIVDHGTVGGKIVSDSYFAIAKNIGKANETTPAEQAKKEMDSLVKKQLRKSYSRTPEEAKERLNKFKTMKIHKGLDSDGNETNYLKKLPKEVLAQVKYNGVWASIRGNETTFYSQTHIEFSALEGLPLTKNIINSLNDNEVLIGEIHNDPKYSETEVSGAIKRDTPNEITHSLKFVVHDVFIIGDDKFNSLPYLDRMNYFNRPGIDLVESILVKKDNLHQFLDGVIKAGREGIVVRDPNCIYECGKRSKRVLKMKKFSTTDYLIKDIVLSDKDVVTFVFAGFNATLNASQDTQYKIYINKNDYIGLMAAVRHDGFTVNGLPKFCKVVSIFDAGTKEYKY